MSMSVPSYLCKNHVMTIIEFVFDSGKNKLLEFYTTPKSSEQDELSQTRDLPVGCELKESLKEWAWSYS